MNWHRRYNRRAGFRDTQLAIWTLDKLLEMKLDHEAKMYAQRLKGSTYGPRFMTLHYVNVPRILIDFALSGNSLSVDGLDLDRIRSLRGLGMLELARILQLCK